MIIRGILFFCLLAIFSWVLMTQFNVPFGTVSYFENHGFLLLVFLTFFPRLTLLFSSIATGGILWWVSWLFFPRILVAVLATFAYFQTNPILVTISWLVALGGESVEKRSLKHSRVVVRRFGGHRVPGQDPIRKADAIDVDYKKL